MRKKRLDLGRCLVPSWQSCPTPRTRLVLRRLPPSTTPRLFGFSLLWFRKAVGGLVRVRQGRPQYLSELPPKTRVCVVPAGTRPVCPSVSCGLRYIPRRNAGTWHCPPALD